MRVFNLSRHETAVLYAIFCLWDVKRFFTESEQSISLNINRFNMRNTHDYDDEVGDENVDDDDDDDSHLIPCKVYSRIGIDISKYCENEVEPQNKMCWQVFCTGLS